MDDLIFVFSVPRCRAPLQVFRAMTKAVQYSQRRMQGQITDETGREADLRAIERQIADTEEKLRKTGFVPGLEDALILF